MRKSLHSDLNPADRELLRFLRQQVDNLQDRLYGHDHHPDIKNDLWRARKELKEFTLKLRRNGVKI
tara:strand:+ start:15 stop:212 length:198 start_codon:yes stop_codon:yes gene_type:complete